MLNSHRILSPRRSGSARSATREVIQHLGYVQIDTISVVARAHHHTLWVRNPRYREGHLDQLLAERKVFEYWSHAAAYLPIEEYRFALPRMKQEASAAGHWHKKDAKLIREVLQRIALEGPLMARDFADPRKSKGVMWDWKPAKYALEQLFMEGKLMTTKRSGFNKVYDLACNVLADDVDTTVPDEIEYGHHLVRRYLNANGLGQAPEFSHLRKGFKSSVSESVEQMAEQGEIEQVTVNKQAWWMLAESEQVLARPLPWSKAKILSPFDNMVILRKRLRSLFKFDYQIECYVPEAKRQHGYYVLPVVWNGDLVARMDCKAHRQQRTFEVRRLSLEPKLKKIDAFAAALAKELKAYAEFTGCDEVIVSDSGDRSFSTLLNKSLAG